MNDFIADVESQYELYCKIAEEHGFIDLDAKKNGFRCTTKSNEFNAGWIGFVGAVAAVREEQQVIIENLKAQLNNMEACYIEKKKQVEELQGQLNKHSECIENLVNQKADYLDRVTKAIAHLDSFDLSQAGMNKLQRSIESALEALRGAND